MPPLDNRRHERFYVYALIDGRDGKPFYIGKGCGNRCNMHMKNWRNGTEKNPAKAERISQIVQSGASVTVAILEDGLSEQAALRCERRTIQEIGIRNLTNIQPGTISDIERAAMQAREALSHIMPFKRWMAIKHRTSADVDLYRGIVSDFEAFSALA